MKNMRSFSMITLSTLLLLSSLPMVAMELESSEYDVQGMKQAASELYTSAKHNAKVAFADASAKAKEGFEAAKAFYNANAPKVVAAAEGFAQEAKTTYANARDGIVHAYNQATTTPVVFEVTTPVTPAPTEVIVVTPVVKQKASFSLKGFFNQVAESFKNNSTKLTQAVKSHPVITGVVVTAIVSIPFAIFGLKKIQKNRKQAANGNVNA